jgi:histone-lysine N-methyltransferase SETMAR
MQLGVDFLRPFICTRPDENLWWIQQRNSEDETFLTRVNTGDKSWIYSYDPETRQKSSQWKSPNSPRLKKATQVKGKDKSMLTIFFDIKQIVHKKIHPGRPNSQFCILMWCFTATARKCVKTLLRTLATKELAAASWQRSVSHFLFHQGISDKNNVTVFPHLPYSPDLAPCDFPVSPTEDKTAILNHNWGDWITGGAEHPHRTWLSAFI